MLVNTKHLNYKYVQALIQLLGLELEDGIGSRVSDHHTDTCKTSVVTPTSL